MAVDLKKLRTKRVDESVVLGARAHRTTFLADWKSRVDKVDGLYKGDWSVAFPDESVETDLPHVMNLVQVTIDDISRLVSEASPSITCFPESEKEEDVKNAYLREAISETHWNVNDGDILLPKLAMDLAGTGTAFLVVDTSAEMYPCIHRIDPRMAYPDVHNGKIQDLLVVQSMKIRVAARMFPRLELEKYDDPDVADEAEVLEYYTKGECVQAVAITKGGEVVPTAYFEVKRWYPKDKDDKPVLPVAFAQLDSFDGEFRGMFDQISGSLNTKNRIVKLMLDYTDRLVYAPLTSKGLLNPEVAFSPTAHYRLDPNTPDSMIGRLQPAGSSPQLYNILEYLDREQRGGVTYPAARQGDVSQSIASASFVASTQGALTSTVRNIQRLLGTMRRQVHSISFRLEEQELDESKPLWRPVGKKKTYSPMRDIGGQYDCMIAYGAGAGLDRLNADVRILQHLGAGLISKETAREQIDYLFADGEETKRIQAEMAGDALAQKFLTEAPWDLVAKVYSIMAKTGSPLTEAVTQVMEAQQAETAPTQAPAQPGTPGPTPEGEAPMSEQLAIQKGRTEAQPGPQAQPKFQGPPITSVLVRN